MDEPHKFNPEETEPIRPWSRDKLDLLRSYLVAYATIMRKQQEDREQQGKRIWPSYFAYIDAFSGPIVYKEELGPEEYEYVAGSPRVALEVNPAFNRYIFIEIRPDRVSRLQQLRKEYPDRAIKVYQGDCNQILRVLAPTIRRARAHGMVFLDPYGLDVEFATVESLSQGPFDVFINFSIMGVTRALLPGDHLPSTEQTQGISRIMGDVGSIPDLYFGQRTIFGTVDYWRGRLPAEELAAIYADNLGKVFRYVSTPVIMRNTKDAPLYALFLASNNSTAVKITNDIFKKYEQLKVADWLGRR